MAGAQFQMAHKNAAQMWWWLLCVGGVWDCRGDPRSGLLRETSFSHRIAHAATHIYRSKRSFIIIYTCIHCLLLMGKRKFSFFVRQWCWWCDVTLAVYSLSGHKTNSQIGMPYILFSRTFRKNEDELWKHLCVHERVRMTPSSSDSKTREQFINLWPWTN